MNPIEPMSQFVQSRSSQEIKDLQRRLQHLEQENQKLNQLQVAYQNLQRENQDLHLTLLTAVEHGDTIEGELQRINQQLRQEIAERQRVEKVLYMLLNFIRHQYSDLQIMLDILTEHGDILDQQWSAKISHVSYLATVDPLTQLANRRKFDEYLSQCWQDLIVAQEPLAILLCDIDAFKQYNDTYGHPQGDSCLQEVAACLATAVPSKTGLVARYGGEEFAVVLPRADIQVALGIAQQIDQAVQSLQIPHKASDVNAYVTLSIGFATVIPTAHTYPQSLVDRADQQLYRAKSDGKNCIRY